MAISCKGLLDFSQLLSYAARSGFIVAVVETAPGEQLLGWELIRQLQTFCFYLFLIQCGRLS